MLNKYIENLKKNAFIAIAIIVPLFVWGIIEEIEFQENDKRARQRAIELDIGHCTYTLHGEYSQQNRKTGYCYSEDGSILDKYTYW